MQTEIIRPFFSIVIPTKNRANLLKIALKSIRMQSYESYELIVVDNDDSVDTKIVCEEVANNKMKYFKTGGLTMLENWNFAVSKASGQWLLVLEDKQALYGGVLKKIAGIIKNHNIQTALVFDCDFYNDVQFNGKGIVSKKKYGGGVSVIDSKDLLERYQNNLLSLDSESGIDTLLPKPQNSVVSFELHQQIKDRFGEYFEFGALDFTSAIAKLILCNKIYAIDSPLLLVTTMKLSNGLNAAIYREETHEREIKITPPEYKDILLKLPFPEFSMTNVFLIDYLLIMKKANPIFNYDINLQLYFKRILKDIYNIHAVIRGVPLSRSMVKFLHHLNSSELDLSSKIGVLYFLIKHIFNTQIYRALLITKHFLDNLKINHKFYDSPQSRIIECSVANEV